MKILYYLPSLYAPGGLERIITFKANWLADHFSDYEVYILTSEQVDRPPFYELSPRVKHIDINVPFDWPFDQSFLSKIANYPSKYRKFKKLFIEVLMEVRPHITISTLRRELNFIHTIKDGSVKIGEFHATRSEYGSGNKILGNPLLKTVKKRWLKKFALNIGQFNKLVLLTEEEKKNWNNLKNTIVIPNPITTPPGKLSDGTAKQVIAVGRFDYSKGFDLLIDSWKIVVEHHPDWVLRIYGDGDLWEAYEKQIERLELKNSCILEKTATDIISKYSESSILAVSSRFEAFGMVITEAMSCALPVVAFACPCGPGDIITHRKDGLLIEEANVTDFAHNLCYLIEEREIRLNMGQEALASSERYKPECILDKWDTLLKQLVS